MAAREVLTSLDRDEERLQKPLQDEACEAKLGGNAAPLHALRLSRRVTMANYHIELRTHERVWDTVDITSADLEGFADRGCSLRRRTSPGPRQADLGRQGLAHRRDDESGLILYAMSIFATDSAATMHARR
jgi:hypothetical protein